MTKLQLEPRPTGSTQQVSRCDLCSREHQNGHYSALEIEKENEEVNYMNNNRRPNNYPNNWTSNKNHNKYSN